MGESDKPSDKLHVIATMDPLGLEELRRFVADVTEFLAAPDPVDSDEFADHESLRPNFYEFAERQRWQMGRWDDHDPVALAILNLVMCQNAVATATMLDLVDRTDVKSALQARQKAAAELVSALEICPDAERLYDG